MGTSKCKNRNQLVEDLWLWCMKHNVWLIAVHIPGAENLDADQQSKVLNGHLINLFLRLLFGKSSESLHKTLVRPLHKCRLRNT